MEIKEMQEKIDKAGKELASMKAILDTEKRSATDEEIKKAKALMDEIESWDKEIDSAEMRARMEGTITKMTESRREAIKTEVTHGRTSEKREFRSFGEQLQAVMMAGSPGGTLDRRLVPAWQGRAATGMSESVPSDGGLI